MKKRTDMHYHCASDAPKRRSFSDSRCVPGQGFRPRDVVRRMIAGAPPPVGRNPVYIDPKFGVDPLARLDVPIEEMAAIAADATERLKSMQAQRKALLASQKTEKTPPVETPPAVSTPTEAVKA